MTDLAQFLTDNYYAHYKGSRNDIVPTPDQLEQGLQEAHKIDRMVVVKDQKIKGVAIYLMLTDETYSRLREMDISQVDTLKRLIPEQGKNMHFILLAADNLKTILIGLKETIKKKKPDTVSWFSPDFREFHKYNLKRK